MNKESLREEFDSWVEQLNIMYLKNRDQLIFNWFLAKFEAYNKEVRTNIMGTLVKNSTGFDTIGNKQLWHVDIEAFEDDVLTLLKI